MTSNQTKTDTSLSTPDRLEEEVPKHTTQTRVPDSDTVEASLSKLLTHGSQSPDTKPLPAAHTTDLAKADTPSSPAFTTAPDFTAAANDPASVPTPTQGDSYPPSSTGDRHTWVLSEIARLESYFPPQRDIDHAHIVAHNALEAEQAADQALQAAKKAVQRTGNGRLSDTTSGRSRRSGTLRGEMLSWTKV